MVVMLSELILQRFKFLPAKNIWLKKEKKEESVRLLIQQRRPRSFFFRDGQSLLQFSKGLEHCCSALSHSVNYSVLLDGSFLNQVLSQKEIQVFSENRTVNVGFVHDVSQLQRSALSQH